MLASVEYAKPLQEDAELASLCNLLRKERCTSYLEIGARYGGSFEAVMRSMPVGSYGMAIDLPGGNFGDGNSAPILLAAAARLRREGYAVDIVFADSASQKAISRANDAGPFDAVFIDGDHSYDAVSRDFANYGTLGRMTVLHDIAAPEHVRSRTGCKVEVPKFWSQLKARGGKILEFIDGNTRMGIGVWYRPAR